MTCHFHQARLAGALALLLPMAGPVAASSLYLDIPTIPGDSLDAGHPGKIDLLAMSWGASVSIRRDAGGLRQASVPSVNDIFWVPNGSLGSAVPLFEALTSGSKIAQADFKLVNDAARGGQAWMTLGARSSQVSSWSIGDSGGAGMTQQVSLSSGALSLEFDPRGFGDNGPRITTSYTAREDQVDGPGSRPPQDGLVSTPPRSGLYLRLGSGDHRIAGDSTSFGHEQWIAIDSYETAVSADQLMPGAAARPSFTTLSWSQRLDATAPVVLRNLLGGDSIGDATLEQVAITASGRAVTVLQLALTDVMFTSFQLEASADGDAMFHGALSFSGYSQTQWLVGADEQRIGPFSTGFDLDAGRRVAGTLAQAVDGFGSGNLDGTEVFHPAPIPEPQTWALMMAGLVAVAALVRRQGARSPS